jgi:hypothetical protein
VVRNGRLPWFLSLPLMAAGCLGAHSAAYRLVEPSGAEAGHGYLAFAPLVLAIGLAVGVVAALHSALARRTQSGAPVYLFALLPPLAFGFQEHLERGLQDGWTALDTVLEPAFLIGLALQLPFALCALALARSVVRAAEAASEVFGRTPALRIRPPIVLRPALVLHAPRASALASPHAGRAPPLPA